VSAFCTFKQFIPRHIYPDFSVPAEIFLQIDNEVFRNFTPRAEAKDNYALGKLEKRIQRADLLIFDEMSYVSFDRSQSELLF